MEPILPNAPLPIVKEVDLCMFVNSNDTVNKWTRRPRTGIMKYMNMSLINWYSKRQSSIKTTMFGAEYVVMKVGMGMLFVILYKLKMMGIPISGLTYIYGDNLSVIHKTWKPESTLKKQYHAISSHAIHESEAMRE